ncbi:MAG: hypothetical protein N5P05_004436 (plasmid) [Chroococcopsis gigantea SAG 12.99]|jgi:hypothetical protein|nr:hypothetical protein [Chlorogloea purpurea SAG 13.99]MDV3002781.1 hypothetical protein [Chroococcopsis gigantea SAG 12.99]
MPTSNSVKYRFALNDRGEIVDINSLSKSEKKKKDKFTCVSCGRVLYAVMPKKRQKHFRHESDAAEFECNWETYLHKLAKQVFEETYRSCQSLGIPFYVEFERISCNHFKNYGENCKLKDPNPIKCDITETFTEISIEKKVGEFRPDILLRSGDGHDHLFIEMVVTHKSSEKKRSSDYKIIELYIENQSDISNIRNHYLKECEKINFFNFPVDEYDYCGGDCQGKYLDYSLCEQAQKAFCETYSKCYQQKRPFLIQFSRLITCNHYFNIDESFKKCDLGKKVRDYDLTRFYGKNIFNHERVDTNLWLQSPKGDKLFIEIIANCPNLLLRDNNLEQNNSTERKIQIYIQDKSDIEIIKKGKLRESNRIKFLNFSRHYEKDTCEGDCEYEQATQNDCKYNVFIVYKSGKAILLTDLTFDEVKDKKSKNPLKFEYIARSELTDKYSSDIDETLEKELYIKKVIQSYSEKIKIKNCYLCRYHASNKYNYYSDGAIFCKFLKETGKSTMAAECDCYRPDEKAFPTPDTPHRITLTPQRGSHLYRASGGAVIESESKKPSFKSPTSSLTNGSQNQMQTEEDLLSLSPPDWETLSKRKANIIAQSISSEVENYIVPKMTVYPQNDGADLETISKSFNVNRTPNIFNRTPNRELIPEELQQTWKYILAHLPEESLNGVQQHTALKYYDESEGEMIIQVFYYPPSMDEHLQAFSDTCGKCLSNSSLKIFAEIYDDNLTNFWERIVQILPVDVREFFQKYTVLRQYSEENLELTIMLYDNFDFDRDIIDIYTDALLEQCKLLFNTEDVLIKIKFLDNDIILQYP